MKRAILVIIIFAIFTSIIVFDGMPVRDFENVKVRSMLTGAANVEENLETAEEYCKHHFKVENDVLCWYGDKLKVACGCPEGSSTELPDPKDILAELQKYVCVRGASIEIPVYTQEGCPACYKDAEINIMPGTLYCDTSCGKVECGKSKTIDTETGTLTCHCNWGGWQHLGGYNFIPQAGGP